MSAHQLARKTPRKQTNRFASVVHSGCSRKLRSYKVYTRRAPRRPVGQKKLLAWTTSGRPSAASGSGGGVRQNVIAASWSVCVGQRRNEGRSIRQVSRSPSAFQKESPNCE